MTSWKNKHVITKNLADRCARCDQFIIGASLGHEFIMCALFYDSSIWHHRDDVSRLDSWEPVSDDDAGSSFSGLIQCRLDSLWENGALSGTYFKKRCRGGVVHTSLKACRLI